MSSKDTDMGKETIFLNSGVKRSKDYILKNRLRTLILSKNQSEPEFYNKIGLSRQAWYMISWGIWDCTESWKIKIAQALDTDSLTIWREDGKR